MPSYRHEALVELFRADPSLAPLLLHRVFGLHIPEDARLDVIESSLAQLVSTEARIDLVLRVTFPGDEKPRLAVIVEVQLERDDDKPFTWPLYQVLLRARERCEVVVLVVTLKRRVARWAARRLALGGGPSWWPLVLGPKDVPTVQSHAGILAHPELAVLSALAHGHDVSSAAFVFEVLVSLGDLARAGALDDEHARVYHDLILASVSRAAKERLEAMFDLKKYEYQSDFAKKHIAEGIALGREEGRHEGREEGREEGRHEGREEGREAGLGAGLLVALRARGFLPSEDVEARVRQAAAPQLERWLERVLSAASLEDVFREDG